MDGQLLWRAVWANPLETTPRLMYSDWLCEQGRDAEAFLWKRWRKNPPTRYHRPGAWEAAAATPHFIPYEQPWWFWVAGGALHYLNTAVKRKYLKGLSAARIRKLPGDSPATPGFSNWLSGIGDVLLAMFDEDRGRYIVTQDRHENGELSNLRVFDRATNAIYPIDDDANEHDTENVNNLDIAVEYGWCAGDFVKRAVNVPKHYRGAAYKAPHPGNMGRDFTSGEAGDTYGPPIAWGEWWAWMVAYKMIEVP